jgi:serine protease Do
MGMVVATCWLGSGAAIGDGMKAEDIYVQVLPSILTLKVENAYGECFTGSAFLAVAPNVAVTAWHVVHDAVRVTALFADGEERPVAGLIDRDERHDLALISVESDGRPLVKLVETTPRVGSKTYLIGAPRGFGFSIVDGLLSQVQAVDGFPQYQVSCPFSTGNSGGPVLNEQAEAIGAASWSKLQAQNLNFAVPANLISRMDHRRLPVAWGQLLQQDPILVRGNHGAPVTDRAPETKSELEALRQVLRAAAGQPVTVVVRRENEPERSFSIIVP